MRCTIPIRGVFHITRPSMRHKSICDKDDFWRARDTEWLVGTPPLIGYISHQSGIIIIQDVYPGVGAQHFFQSVMM